MELVKHLSPEQLLLNIEVVDKWELLDRMVDALLEHPICLKHPRETVARIRASVLERERQISTGMGHGFALPHARIKGFDSFVLCIATLKHEIDFESAEPVKIACMVICPEEQPTVALKILSALTSFLLDARANDIFTNEEDPERLYSFLGEKRISFDVSILARDIMRHSFPVVNPETPLREVTGIMYQHRVGTIGIVDAEKRLVGHITCDGLFRRGIPDFFNQLSSISFIRHFDPFEKYFEAEADATAIEMAEQDYAVVDERATLMEVVFLLSVKGHSLVFVVKEGCLVGTIDRGVVLNQVLNL